MGLAILLIVFKGSNSAGQSSVISAFFTSYIEETAASVTINPSQNQLADINSVFSYSGTSGRTAKTSALGLIQDNSIISHSTILTDIIDQFSDRGNEISTYEVQDGDTLSFVASDFGVNINTIIWANSLKNADDIRPGMILKIPPVNGIVHIVQKGETIGSISSKYSGDSQKIIAFNSLPADGSLQIGSELIIPDGKMNIAPSGNNGKIKIDPTITARFSYLPNLGSYFILPAVGFDWGRIHGRNGVDVANSCGTPIGASAEGSVTLAKSSGWNGGYGKYIKISHPNGTETLYGHLSKILVTIGENVAKNQTIALMGTTGNSTGCHLHFEVHGARNPLAKY